MKHLYVILSLFIFIYFNINNRLSAQFAQNIKDSIHYTFSQKPQFLIGFDSRRSFISGRAANIFGARLGLEFNQRVKLGIGIYGLTTEIRRNFIRQQGSAPDTVNAQLNFGYLAFFIEPIWLNKKRWQISTPLYTGLGSTHYDPLKPTTEAGFFLIELSGQVVYKIIPWLGIGGGAGYRQLFATKNSLFEQFNAPVYLLYVKIYLSELYQKLFPKPD